MKVPYQTENLAMAIALHLAGVRSWQDNCFAFVLYDESILHDLACATVPDALAAGLPGKRVCNFDVRDPQLEALQEVWDMEKLRIEKDLPSSIEASPEDVVRIAARVFHCRKQLVKDWQDLPIYVLVRNEGEVETKAAVDSGPTIVIHPGFKLVNFRASQKILSHLGLAGANATNGGEEDEDEEEAE